MPDGDPRATNFFGSVELSVATASPLGPWTPLGAWTIELGLDGKVAPFLLDRPIWARYVRFAVEPEPGVRRIHFADQITIRERPVDQAYRSILGTWSTNTRAAFYEHEHPTTPIVGEDDDNDSRATADPLRMNERVAGTVELDEDQDWFVLQIPETGRLTIALERQAGLDLAVRMSDEFGNQIDFDQISDTDTARQYLAWVQAGPHFVQLVEPPRSLIVTWDTSGSVGAYVDSIFQAVRSFALDISPGLEEVNFVPFADVPGLLLPAWTGDPTFAFATLHAYDTRNYSSSNAELNLVATSDALIDREGVRALLVLTDAESGGYGLTADLWQSLARSNPRIFTVGVRNGQRGIHARFIDNFFEDLAFLNDGYHQYLSGEGAVEVAFQRLAAWLRRPASYAMTASFEAVEPEPGALEVIASADALSGLGAIEVILDASGSMLARIDGVQRIAIAKEVLSDVVAEILPAGTPFALRVFGQGEPGSCETELVAPVAPLDPVAAIELIDPVQPTNLAKTPIGESLARVADDLAGIAGPRLIILLTDGEETCDGDPAAEIDALRDAGFDVRINIVGFAIDDAELSATFNAWATAGGGSYFEAADQETLRQALIDAVRPSYEVLRGGEIVANGRLGGDEIELPPGAYDIRVMTSPERLIENIVVEPMQMTSVTVN